MIILCGLSIIKKVLEERKSGRIEKGEKYSALLNLGMIDSL